MAIGINGVVSRGFAPYDHNSSNLAGAFWDYRLNTLKSANDQLRYQIQWFNGNSLTEGVEPSKENWTGATPDATTGNGDLVNVIFKVYSTTDGNALFPAKWDLIGTVKKSRDIVNVNYADEENVAGGHRFTVDISQLVSDELSYSLCPLNKGTWQSNYYGGMNGGLTMQDNVLNKNSAFGTPVSQYNVSKNGTFRRIRVVAYFEVINGDGEIVSAASSTQVSFHTLSFINSVNQFGEDGLYYYNSYNIGSSSSVKYRLLTRCPNWSDTTTYDFKKPVRLDEQGEFLQFYIRDSRYSSISGGSNTVGAMGLKVEAFESDGSTNTFYLRDFEGNALTDFDGNNDEYLTWGQHQMFMQNISPSYINNTAALKTPSNKGSVSFPYWTAYGGDKITASTVYYRVSLSKFGLYAPYTEQRQSKLYYYTIDREDAKTPYPFVRFHWLNSVGGIDSYTAKRDIVEGYSISRDIVERKSGDRTWYQDDKGSNGSTGVSVPNASYISDTMRGGDIYKGGREVSSVNAEKTQSVYTEPINTSVAEWLKEIMLSPNVWIEKDFSVGYAVNPYLRPSSDKEYIPVIITNSDIQTINQEQGLVKFNIEYTLAHKIITQRN
jgi:hypothetical protein